MPRPDDPTGLMVGTEVEVEVGPVAHGGHCVARHEGQVLFVRHALPGERVLARVTEVGRKARFLRADAVEVREASPDRVEPPCPWAGPARCGGCDFQHATPAAQRALKTTVVREQFARLAGIEVDVEVEALPGREDGLGWRTRVEFAVGDDGRPGLRPHRSHAVLPVDDCLIADDRIRSAGVLGRFWPGEQAVDVVAPSTRPDAVVVPVPSGEAGAPVVTEDVGTAGWSGAFEVGARGFWQVHEAAPRTFVAAALEALDPQPGEKALDLYAGVGLFARALADAVGPTGAVLAVESDRTAMEHAEVNAGACDWITTRPGRVDRVLAHLVRQDVQADLVVLDPPRTGAGADVCRDVAALGARAVVYVACDPAALARDTASLRDHGLDLVSLRAFDAFPMTHHVECVALFTPRT